MDFAKNNGTTSVKVHHAPGGKSNFSLSWDADLTKLWERSSQHAFLSKSQMPKRSMIASLKKQPTFKHQLKSMRHQEENQISH